MAQDEHILRSNYSGGGGGEGGGGGGGGGVNLSNRSKNVSSKQKKVPQRGLGVAQLEKIRLEEQRKKDALQAANVLAKNAIQSTNFRPSISPSLNSVPLPPSSPTNIPSPSVPGIEIPITKQLNGGRGEIGNWPKMLWNGELSLEGEKQRVDHLVFGFGRQVNLPYAANSSGLPMRSHPFQPPCSSSMVNASSGISPSSISSSQMELPSNQSFRGNSNTSLWPEEDKMVGMKRSYPFPLESPRGPSFHCNFNSTYAASKSRSDELSYTEPSNKYIRDGPSNSSPLPERNPIEVIRDDEELNGDLLTLAPPIDSSPPSNSQGKQNLDYSGHNGMELSDFKRFPSQENVKSQSFWWGSCGSTEQQPFSFFPDKPQTDQSTTTCVSNGSGEKAETIDLNLKL
ncbi:hypothetical protein BUALT_Bualt03G0143000 [Buddleja alternifolia]|uniref:Uncharacterized protein n=1 Tax=Buddleja alternifolia TaxID=168488 RepID=A0AAV6Y0C5_9LAMI|nr:hypothetical protein BUALT_Bualt03G0143000 [Buddleja alternifolia]